MADSKRIVSLLPNATEIVCKLGLQDQLVGRSHECDFPEDVTSLPALTEAKVATDTSSKEIDDRITDLLQRGMAVYEVDTQKLEELHPDVVITQTQCEVCAASESEVKNALQQLHGASPELVSLEPTNLNGVLNDILTVSMALDVHEEGTKVVNRLKERMNKIRDITQTLPLRPKVACVEWIDPLMTAGNWMPELVEMAGGTNVATQQGQHSHFINWQDLQQEDPDVIVLMPCGFDRQQTESEFDKLTQHPGWQEMKAVRNKRVFITDGHQYFNRPGPRIVESLQILAELIHPEVFQYGFESNAWKKAIS
jgi:iron complex transport system substrate-binding protein